MTLRADPKRGVAASPGPSPADHKTTLAIFDTNVGQHEQFHPFEA